MSRYKYSEDLRFVILDDGHYSIMNDLRYADDFDGTRPYVRRNTKIDIYKDYKNNHPDMYKTLRQRSWFDAYLGDVEDTPDMVVPQGVFDFIEGKKKDEERYGSGDEGKELKVFEESIQMLANKIGDMSVEISAMNTNTKLEEALIEGIVSKGKDLATEEIRQELINNLDDYIKEVYGTLPTRLIITNKEVEYERTGLFHEQFDKVVKLVNMGLPVMLTGGAGTGKNFMLEQVSQALDLSFYYTSTITQEYKLTGFIDGGGTYHETEFYKALTQGGVFFLDEIDASIPEALVILNGAIANGYFDFPIGREIAHEDFRVVAAGNTVGLGADMVYTGRNVLDGATLDRFVLVEMDYDTRIEENLCQDSDLRTFLYDVRKAVTSNHINHIVGMRAFQYSYNMLVNEFDKEFIIKSVILKGLLKDDINVIKSDIDRHKTKWHKLLGGM